MAKRLLKTNDMNRCKIRTEFRTAALFAAGLLFAACVRETIDGPSEPNGGTIGFDV